MRTLAPALVLAAVTGCGSTTRNTPGPMKAEHDPASASVGNADPGTPDRPSSEHRADFEPCESTIEDHQPGNRDRYRFDDPVSGLVGFKNGAGAIVIPATFKFAYEFGPGGIAAAVDGTTPFVFIDTTGKVIAKAFAFDNGPDYFQDGLARIVDPRGKIGFIDTTGAIPIAPQFDDASSFCHGKAEVAVGKKTFVIDRAGKTVAP